MLGLAWGERELPHADAAAERLAADLLAGAGAAAGTVTTHVVAAGGSSCYALAVEVEDAADVGASAWMEQGGAAVTVGDGEDSRLGDPTWADAARAAAAERSAGRGRAVVFPGSGDLHGTMPVARAIQVGRLDGVRLLGGGPAELDGSTQLVTRDFVRPVVEDGALVLYVTPRADGSVEPFERRAPHECCTDHPSG